MWHFSFFGGDPSKTDARIHGNVQVDNGAKLSGFGTVEKSNDSSRGRSAKVLIKSGGILAPESDSTVGTFNVYNLEFEKDSIFRVKALETGQSDKIITAGNVNIQGGTVDVRDGIGSWGDVGKQRDYVIISKEGGVWNTKISGTFDNVTSDLAFLDPSLSYTDKEVNLHLVRNKTCFSGVGDCGTTPPPPGTTPPVNPPSISIGGAVLTWNQYQVGTALDVLEATLAANGGQHDLLDAALGLTHDDMLPAYDNLSGEIYPGTGEILLQNSRQVRDAVYNRLHSGWMDDFSTAAAALAPWNCAAV